MPRWRQDSKLAKKGKMRVPVKLAKLSLMLVSSLNNSKLKHLVNHLTDENIQKSGHI